MNDLMRDVQATYRGLQALDIKPTKNNLTVLSFALDTLTKVYEVFDGILKNENKDIDGGDKNGSD